MHTYRHLANRAESDKRVQHWLAWREMIRPQPARRAAWRPPAARRPQCAVKWDRNLKPKLAIMRQCTSVTDRRTDGLAPWHTREMYILHRVLKTGQTHGSQNRFLLQFSSAMAINFIANFSSFMACSTFSLTRFNLSTTLPSSVWKYQIASEPH